MKNLHKLTDKDLYSAKESMKFLSSFSGSPKLKLAYRQLCREWNKRKIEVIPLGWDLY